MYLNSRYEARISTELPVLARWFDKEAIMNNLGVKLECAKYLDVILYSKE